jgi:hypothetical protein
MKLDYPIVSALTILIGILFISSSYSAPSNLTTKISAEGAITYNSFIYAFTVFANSSGYYAKNANGIIVFSSTNAADVIKDIFGSSWKGGSVLFQNGLYILSPQILHISNTVIDGQGDSSILQLAPGQSALSHPRLLEVLDSYNVTIENIHFDGNLLYNNITDNVVMGLDIVDSWNVTVQNCYFTNWRVFGIYVASATSGADVHDIVIRDNRVVNCLWNGISIYSMVSGARIHNVTVESNYIEGSGDIGLDVFAEVSASRPYDNTFVDNAVNGFLTYPGYGSSGTDASAYGVRLEAGNNQLVKNNIIYNSMTGVGDSVVQGGSGNNTFSGNTIWVNGSTTWAGVDLFDQYNTVGNNDIYGFHAYNVGVEIRGSNNLVESNTIISNTTNFEGIAQNPQTNPNNTSIINNDLSQCKTGHPIVLASGTGTIMYGNVLPP